MESFLQRKLHTMWCTDLTKVNKHLDEMIEIRDSLTVQDIAINDKMFINTIIASIPDTFWPTINTLVVVHSHAKEKLNPLKLIAVIHAEVLSYVKKSEQKKESAHYAGSSNRGKGSF